MFECVLAMASDVRNLLFYQIVLYIQFGMSCSSHRHPPPYIFRRGNKNRFDSPATHNPLEESWGCAQYDQISAIWEKHFASCLTIWMMCFYYAKQNKNSQMNIHNTISHRSHCDAWYDSHYIEYINWSESRQRLAASLPWCPSFRDHRSMLKTNSESRVKVIRWSHEGMELNKHQLRTIIVSFSYSIIILHIWCLYVSDIPSFDQVPQGKVLLTEVLEWLVKIGDLRYVYNISLLFVCVMRDDFTSRK